MHLPVALGERDEVDEQRFGRLAVPLERLESHRKSAPGVRSFKQAFCSTRLELGLLDEFSVELELFGSA